MAYDSNQLLVAVKAFSRSNPLPIDATSVYDSLEEAQTYAKAANAYAGQIVTVKQDGDYIAYVLNGESGSYTLDKIGVDASEVKNYVQVVAALPGSGQEQGVIYINTTDSKGYIWNGSEFQVVFEDVTTEEGESLSDQIAAIETELGTKADLDGATFTGTVTLAADPQSNLEAATKQYVDRLVAGINDFTVGIVDSGTPLPTQDYKVGQTFRVAEAGTYAGQECEVGDLIIVIADYDTAAKDSDFLVVQANVDGAVTGPDASTDANIAVFDGITGRKIKDSSVTIASVSDAVAKAHEHTNKDILDTFTKNQTTIESELKGYTDTAVADKVTDGELTTALESYYTKTDVDGLLTPITTNLNTKIDANDLAEAIGEIGDGTVKEYVDQAVQSGGADVSAAIQTAINNALKINEFE